MKTETQKPESKAMTPEELASNYATQRWDIVRKKIAVNRRHPGCATHYRRAASVGPNREFAIVWILAPGKYPKTEVISYAELERLADQVTDAEVLAWFAENFSNSDE